MPADFPVTMLGRSSFLLGKLHSTLLDIESRELGRIGLDVKQHAVLTVLADEGPMTQQGMGLRLGIDRTTVVSVVDGLDENGLVERRRSPTDRRAYLLTLTRSGRQAQRRGQRLVEGAEKRLFGGLSEEERETIVELLARALNGQPSQSIMPGAS